MTVLDASLNPLSLIFFENSDFLKFLTSTCFVDSIFSIDSTLSSFLKKRKISYKIDTKFKMIKILNKMFMRKKNFNTAEKKLRTIGQKILNNTYNNIKIFI